MANADSWLARVREVFKPKRTQDDAARNALIESESWVVGRPMGHPDGDLRQTIDLGYRQNVVVYVCVNEIATTIPQAKLLLRNRKTLEEVEEHPILDLLARPSPSRSLTELLEAQIIYQQTAGDSYIHKGRNTFGEVVQLAPIRPDRMYPIAGTYGIEAYEYRLPGQSKGLIIPADDVISMGLFDPLDSFHGLSPLKVAVVWGALDVEAAQYLMDFFANGAMPMGLLRMKSPAVRPDDRVRVKKEWQEQYGSVTNALNKRKGMFAAQASGWHSVAVLGGDVEFQAIGVEPKQLAMDSVFGMSETRICAAYGVPVTVVQLKAGMAQGSLSDGSKQREARRTLWTETLVPISRRVAASLTRGLLLEEPELEFYFDTDEIPELQEDLKERTERGVQMFSAGIISRNEARVMADFEEDEEDFVFEPSAGTMKPKDQLGVPPEPPPLPAGAPGAPGLPGRPQPRALPPGRPAPKALPPGKQEDDGEWEVYGLGGLPDDEPEILSASTSLAGRFAAAVQGAVDASDLDELQDAIARGDWRAAERAVATQEFVDSYTDSLARHLAREAEKAERAHSSHHDTETHKVEGDGHWVTIRGNPVFIRGPRGSVSKPAVTKPSSGGPTAGIPPELAHLETVGKYTTAGEWDPQRKQLHKEIVDRIFEGHTPVSNPKYRMTGGGPASGKSAVRDAMLEENHVLIDPDAIREQIPEYSGFKASSDDKVQFYASALTHEEASYVTGLALQRAAAENYNTVYDSTGDGKFEKLVSKLDNFRQGGGTVEARYVGLDIDTAIERADERGSRLGRYVPHDTIRETHRAVARTFPMLRRSGRLDSWKLYDNSGTSMKLIAESDGRRSILHDRVAYKTFLRRGR